MHINKNNLHNQNENENEQLIKKLLNVQAHSAQNKTLTISIVGAGGKTHLSFWLANFFKQLGLSVCLTTTTKMYYPDEKSIDHIVKLSDLDSKAMSENLLKKTPFITFLYQETLPIKTINEPTKVEGLQQETLETIIDTFIFDVVIVEADGAKHHPIKAPARHEPCIAKESQIVIGVTGAEAIFSKANSDKIHRWREFSALTHCLPQMEISQTILKCLLNSPQGMFKGAPEQATKIWVINKYDLCTDQLTLLGLVASLLKELPLLKSIWLTQLNVPDAIKSIFINQ
tara:strand:- start:11426 stop:12283 length:858 start_codon:yes stop_codon:yes gene_type:complete